MASSACVELHIACRYFGSRSQCVRFVIILFITLDYKGNSISQSSAHLKYYIISITRLGGKNVTQIIKEIT